MSHDVKLVHPCLYRSDQGTALGGNAKLVANNSSAPKSEEERQSLPSRVNFLDERCRSCYPDLIGHTLRRVTDTL